MQNTPPSGQAALPERDIYSISRLVREAKAVLEGSFPLLWIEGEISNFSRPSSGHIYFSLKDEAAQVRCAMFRAKNLHLRFKPENGMHVRVRARITLYEARADFQLVIEQMEEAGLGALQRAFEELKNRLGREGLFDTRDKKELPTLPQRIGIITSPSGAAIRDIISVLQRRFPSIPLLIYPVPVQGSGAAAEIAAMIKLADQRQECDLLILTRGGGSLEDLWAFNEERVARAIHACSTPLISAVGHEIDFTIADFVADRRAPTPSAAAEMASPDQAEMAQQFARHASRLSQRLNTHMQQHRRALEGLEKRLQRQHPGQRLQTQGQRLDELELRLKRQMHNSLLARRRHLAQLDSQLLRHAPLQQLSRIELRQQQLQQRLHHAWERIIGAKRQRLAVAGRSLDNISPLATLQRGYAIVQDGAGKKVIRDAAEVNAGDKITARLAQGQLLCTVDEIKTE